MNTRVIYAGIIAVITIAAIIFAYDGTSTKRIALACCLCVFAFDILRGIFGKSIIVGYSLINRTKENESRYAFGRAFNFMIWLGIIGIMVIHKG